MTELDQVLEGISRVEKRVETLTEKTGEFQLEAVQRLSRVEERLIDHPDPAVCAQKFAKLDVQTAQAVEVAKSAETEARKAAGIVATAVAGVVSVGAAAWQFIKGDE
jgi:hypothetical protein